MSPRPAGFALGEIAGTLIATGGIAVDYLTMGGATRALHGITSRGGPPQAPIRLGGPGSSVRIEASPAVFADGGPPLAKNGAEADVDEAVRYLWRSPTARETIWKADAAWTPIRLIVNNEGEDSYDAHAGWDREVHWDPRVGEKEAGRSHSPAVSLIHELAHAVDNDERGWGASRMTNTPDPDYDDLAERAAILGVEDPTARELGEDERHDHGGADFLTTGPTSRIPLKRERDIGLAGRMQHRKVPGKTRAGMHEDRCSLEPPREATTMNGRGTARRRNSNAAHLPTKTRI